MSKKIVFMGTPEFSIRTLETLNNSKYDISCVYTQPPKKSSRGQKINSSPIQLIAEKLKLNIKNTNDLNNENEYEFFKSLNPFIVIVVAYGKIIPKKYLNIPKKGFVNIHASLLPKWRGAAPIQRSIMNCDKETGISIMKIEEGLDTGPYMKQFKKKIEQQATSKILSDELSKLSAVNILECIDLIAKDKAIFIEQNSDEATYAKKIDKLESKIVWNENSINILSKINGLNPTPGAWFKYDGFRYKVWEAKVVDKKGNPGEILDENFTVACKDKSLKILKIQKEGKNILSIKNFLAGTKIYKGKNISE